MNNSLSAIRQEGYRALNNNLGAVGAIIFMKQFESGYGDYTEERGDTLNDITLNDIAKSIQKNKKR